MKPATTVDDFRTIERLAREIVPAYYLPTLAADHIEYFLDRFQSLEAITAQVRGDFEYFLFGWGQLPVGYLGLQKSGATLVLSKLYILEAHRGHGIGRRALEFTDGFARSHGFQRIVLGVNRHNAAAIAIYLRFGYTLRDLKAHHFEDGQVVEEYRMDKSVE